MKISATKYYSSVSLYQTKCWVLIKKLKWLSFLLLLFYFLLLFHTVVFWALTTVNILTAVFVFSLLFPFPCNLWWGQIQFLADSGLIFSSLVHSNSCERVKATEIQLNDSFWEIFTVKCFSKWPDGAIIISML